MGIGLLMILGTLGEYAENAAGKTGKEARLATANVSAKNPLTVTFDDRGRPMANGAPVEWESNTDVINYAKRNGHDAVDFPGGSFTDEPAFVVFNGKQARFTD